MRIHVEQCMKQIKKKTFISSSPHSNEPVRDQTFICSIVYCRYPLKRQIYRGFCLYCLKQLLLPSLMFVICMHVFDELNFVYLAWNISHISVFIMHAIDALHTYLFKITPCMIIHCRNLTLLPIIRRLVLLLNNLRGNASSSGTCCLCQARSE